MNPNYLLLTLSISITVILISVIIFFFIYRIAKYNSYKHLVYHKDATYKFDFKNQNVNIIRWYNIQSTVEQERSAIYNLSFEDFLKEYTFTKQSSELANAMRQQMDTGKCTKTALSTLYNSLSSTVADAISIYEGETNKVAIIKIRNIDVENQVLFSTVNEFHSNVFTTQWTKNITPVYNDKELPAELAKMTKKSKKSRSVLFSITPIETLESQTSAIPSDLIYSNIITVLKEHGIKAIRTPNKDIFGIYDAFTSRVVQKQNIQAKRAIKSALSSISKTRNIISPRHTITVSNIRNNSVEDLFNAISFSMVYSGYDASEPEVQKLERAKDELDKIYKFANNLEKQYNSKNFTLDTVRIRLSKSLNRDVYFAPLSFDSVRLISSKTTLLKFALLEKVLKQINTIQEESPNKPIIYRVHFSFVETLQQLLVTEYIDPRIDIQISLNMFEKKPSHQQQKSLKLLANNTKNKVSFYISSQSMAVNPLLKKTDIAYVLFSSNVEQLKNQSQSFEIFYNEILSTTKVKNIPLYVESTNKSSK